MNPLQAPIRWALALILCLGCAACDREHVASAGSRTALELATDDPASLAVVAPFSFQSSDGRTVTNLELQGKVWIVDFFFTTCSGPCPRITGQMRALQDELAGTQVRLVSVTVDPEIDTPQVLAEYAQNIGADLSRWWFLRGEEAKTYELIRSSFALPVERVNEAVLGMQVSHATKLIVVDGRGRVRGYYAGETPDGRAMAHDRARWLAAHPDA